MDYNRIKILLDKYWECATTIEEERELRHFFSAETLPPELRPYKAWFLTPEAETLPPLGKEFDLKVLQRIAREKRQRHLRLFYSFSVLITFIFVLLFILILTSSFMIENCCV
ncbi:hypothetical protein [Parabacteroides timonensis]|uniref:hypothetical protein n=1 Tax=Parabacteroides timonensis TaxID=1871013 RepID=UPI00094F26D7|nr:hypothetical protein [Parabacteroides timonensis]